MSTETHPKPVAVAIAHLTRSDAFIAADRDGIIRFWNPGAERIFGHVQADAIGRSLDLIIPERSQQRHWDGSKNRGDWKKPLRRGRYVIGACTPQKWQDHFDRFTVSFQSFSLLFVRLKCAH